MRRRETVTGGRGDQVVKTLRTGSNRKEMSGDGLKSRRGDLDLPSDAHEGTTREPGGQSITTGRRRKGRKKRVGLSKHEG